jgi:hypothetical protein
MYSAVQDKSANYTVVAGDAGDLIRVTTTSGAVTITLPTISTVSDGFKIAIVKWTGDANAVTVARSSTNTINGATSVTIGAQYSSTIFVADFETNQWFAASSGLGTSNVAVDAFSGDNSTVAFTLSADPGSENNTQVYVSGVYQEKDTYTVSGTTLTFSTAPPTGTSNIEVVSSAPLAIGTPSDGTVTTAKLASTTGSGAVVLATSPTLVTPALGTPSALVLTNATGLPQAGLATNVAGNGPAFSAYGGASYSITQGVDTKVRFNTERFDTANCFDNTTNYRFTPNVAGYYQVNYIARFAATAPTIAYVMLFKNGSLYVVGNQIMGISAGTNFDVPASEIVSMNGTTDYLEVYLNVGGGSSISINDANLSTFTSQFSGFLARAA